MIRTDMASKDVKAADIDLAASLPKREPEPVVAPEPPQMNSSEQVEIDIARGWCAAGITTEAERDITLANIRRRYHGGR